MKSVLPLALHTLLFTQRDWHGISRANYHHYHPDIEVTPPTESTTKVEEAGFNDEETKQLVAWNCNFMGQVVQAKRFEDINVLICEFRASFYTATCSWSMLTGYRQWSTIPAITNTYLQLTRSECENALKTQILKYTDRTYYSKEDFLSIHLICQDNSTCTGSGWRTI